MIVCQAGAGVSFAPTPAHALPILPEMEQFRRGQAHWIKTDLDLLVKSCLHVFASEFTDDQRLAALTRLAKQEPIKEVNGAVILALNHSLAAFSVASENSPGLDVIKAMLDLLYAKGDASHANQFKMVIADFQTVRLEIFRTEIAPLIRRTLEAMNSRVLRLESLENLQRGRTREEIEKVLSFAQGILAETEGRPNNVVPMSRCRAAVIRPDDNGEKP